MASGTGATELRAGIDTSPALTDSGIWAVQVGEALSLGFAAGGAIGISDLALSAGASVTSLEIGALCG